MDTRVVKTEEGGRRFNRWNELVIKCQKGCGNDTTMTGTRLCDFCWEAQRRVEREAMLQRQ